MPTSIFLEEVILAYYRNREEYQIGFPFSPLYLNKPKIDVQGQPKIDQCYYMIREKRKQIEQDLWKCSLAITLLDLRQASRK